MSTLAIDHMIIVVKNLELASNQFNQVGFSVIPGGVHSGGLTHNALVPFQDGTYLELLATTRPATLTLLMILKRLKLLSLYTSRQSAISRRLIEDIACGVGIIDYCMFSTDLIHDVTASRQRGLTITDPIPGGRLRPDGKEVNWRTAVPEAIDIPFLIDDLTPRELRVPNVDNQFHSNQVVGIYGVSILVSKYIESIAHYQCLLGEEPVEETEIPQPGTQTRQFNLAGKVISLAGLLPGTSSLRKSLHHRQARPFGIFFQTQNEAPNNILAFTYSNEKGAALSSSHKLI